MFRWFAPARLYVNEHDNQHCKGYSLKEKPNLLPLARPDCFLTTSKGIAGMDALPRLLGAPVEFCRSHTQLKRLQRHYESLVMLAWGQKPTAVTAEALARRHSVPMWRLEDGFLRSIGLGHESPPLSIVVDDVGIYYDARTPSRLEQLIAQPWPQESAAEQEARASNLILAWRAARVSKYNAARETLPTWLDEQPFVLVVDQTYGDASITSGLADTERFQVMLNEACARYPEHLVVIKTHPDVMAGTKRAHFAPADFNQQPQVRFLAQGIHPPALLERAEAVFCVTSQMGFEALLWGKPTYTFGLPFYAGWGLTHDWAAAPERRVNAQPSLAKLVSAALIEYPRYQHPETGADCTIEAILPWFALQRRQQEALPETLWAGRWPRWKKPVLSKFLRGSQLLFSRRSGKNSANFPTVGWGAHAATDIRVEDGFIRSVGLGADLVLPQSWVVDSRGMYYDATRPSDLEHLLANYAFSDTERQRAAALIARLNAAKVSKYNVGNATWRRPEQQIKVILIPGQVESDASIQLGSPVYKQNLALIEQVRLANPDAYLVYKPHPDVQAGLRIAGSAEQRASEFVDEVVLHEDMAHLLSQVDEVHTLTSLTGFEALLRGVAVTCYGQPFYAGWGLTTDRLPPERRGRALLLTELVAGTLILYPRYISQTTGYFTTVEQALEELIATRNSPVQKSQSQQWLALMKQTLRRVLQRFKRF